MRYRLENTSEEIIAGLANPTGEQVLNCEDCGDIIGSGERYFNINGEILCEHCMSLRYERINGDSPI